MARRKSTFSAVKRSLPRAVVVVAGLWLAACQGILGVDDWTPKAVSADAGAKSSCLRASDCAGSQVCLFKTCSDPCASDKDCTSGTYCLKSNDGTACVSQTQAQCGKTECPKGTACVDGHCATSCDGDAACPGGQHCVTGACVSSPIDGGNGAGGASGGGPNGGASGGGAAGATGAGGRELDASSGGTDGGPVSMDAGVDAGSGGTGDGTAVGTADAKCPTNGALACSGHAARGELTCESGVWKPTGTCSGQNLCDTTLGTNAGSCQPIVVECNGQAAGFRFCRAGDSDVRECGLDLVTTTVVDTCQFICVGGACTGSCHPGDLQCKTGTEIPQLCDSTGTWQDQTACATKCDAPTGKCIAASCTNKLKDPGETDVDCGGSCGGCPINGICLKDTDCIQPTSGKCTSGKCTAATCSDGAQNGDETDKDCGGSCPGKCVVSQGCALDSDCKLPESGHCSAGKCVAAQCNDGIKNGNETDKDCGGLCASGCVSGGACLGAPDCASRVCLTGKCVECQPTTKQCAAGTAVQTCDATGSWGGPVACALANAQQSCTGGVCGIAGCQNGYGNCDGVVANGCETNLNSPSTCGTTCATKVCSSANGTPDCLSGACGTSGCNSGYANCSNTANDGCETNLNSPSTCGTLCGSTVSCSAANGTASCVGGKCDTSACNSGFANCSNAVNDGCETNLNSASSCGTNCTNKQTCSFAHATPSCTSGTCGILSCNAGYANCDNVLSSGCETYIWSALGCGTTCANLVTCSTNHGTPSCSSGACVMACAAGYADCGGANDGCETNLNSIASCGTSCVAKTICGGGQICTNNQCVTNNPYNVGQVPSGWPTFAVPADTWYIVSIVAPKDATVLGFRVVGAAAGGSWRMAMWSDQAGPNAFIAQGASTPLAAGVNSSAPTPANTTVLAGHTYWIGIVTTGGAQIYQNSLPGALGYDYSQSFGSNPATTLSPFPIAAAGTFTDAAIGIYLLVQDIPQ